ncbi:MAG: DUF1735 domain-containing protein [Odoribacter splanchnicus]
MRKINLIFTVVLFLFVSCSNDVDYGEQYRKEFYIVGSSQTLQYAFHEIDKASPGHISVYCTGSELLSKDAVVNYKVDKEYLDRFNRNEYGKEEENYFQVVPEIKSILNRTNNCGERKRVWITQFYDQYRRTGFQ